MAELNARVPCTDDTRSRLKSLKEGSERYEDVLQRLLEEHGESL
jgi:predicted CopG family antitoxin